MSTATHPRHPDAGLSQTWGDQRSPPLREPFKWYDWPLLVCASLVSWSAILASAVRVWNGAAP